MILSRTRLVEGLLSARSARVVVLEAPAGYSKTTTVRLWEEADRRPFAWVRCEPRHNDPAVLVETVVESLGEIGVDSVVMEELNSPVPDLGLLLKRIGAALEAVGPLVLFIDDAHLLDSDGAWQVLYSLIVDLPSGSQLAVASRGRPGLPLGRLRARGELYEVGMNDLALTRRESRELLAGLDLELGERADEIHERAEGWPAAMYLAGLAIRQGGDAQPESAKFDGGDRVVVEYFRDEFFQEMPEEQARFLYMTSIVEELNGPLCDALTDQKNSLSVLRALSAENALIVPLDRADTTFRYHHLFRDMLRSELQVREPDAVADLQRRAAVWFAENGDIARGTDHAILAGDIDLTGAYIWLDIRHIMARGRIATLDRWFEAIGDEQVSRIPALILARGYRELGMGYGDASYYWLSVAERQIDEDSHVYGERFILRATIGSEGPQAMLADAERAIELLDPASPWLVHARQFRALGLCLGDRDGAIEAMREVAREAVVAESPVVQVMTQSQIALAELDRGNVEKAYEVIIRARDAVERNGLGILRVMSLAYAVLALVRAELGQLERASRDLDTSRRVGEGMVDFVGWHEAEVALSRCRTLLKTGQFDLAAAELRDAEAATERFPGSPVIERWIAACRARLGTGSESGTVEELNLTKAEIRTLQFLPSHHSFRAIGERLYLSQNTIKTQANSLYRKLGVNSRAEAVMEGRRLGLLDGDAE